MVRFSQESQPSKMRLVGQRNKDFEEWLGRSLVCTAEEPCDLATLSSAIMDGFGQCSKISALSSFKFLLTFPTEEGMIEALAHQEELQQWFLEIKKWGIEDYCDTRKVWLDIMGVPPMVGSGKISSKLQSCGEDSSAWESHHPTLIYLKSCRSL